MNFHTHSETVRDPIHIRKYPNRVINPHHITIPNVTKTHFSRIGNCVQVVQTRITKAGGVPSRIHCRLCVGDGILHVGVCRCVLANGRGYLLRPPACIARSCSRSSSAPSPVVGIAAHDDTRQFYCPSAHHTVREGTGAGVSAGSAIFWVSERGGDFGEACTCNIGIYCIDPRANTRPSRSRFRTYVVARRLNSTTTVIMAITMNIIEATSWKINGFVPSVHTTGVQFIKSMIRNTLEPISTNTTTIEIPTPHAISSCFL